MGTLLQVPRQSPLLCGALTVLTQPSSLLQEGEIPASPRRRLPFLPKVKVSLDSHQVFDPSSSPHFYHYHVLSWEVE